MISLTRRTFSLQALAGSLAFAAGAVPLSRARAAEQIHVGILPLTSHAPSFIAAAKGYFAAEGLDAAFVSFQAAEPMAVAIASGDVDFGVTAITGGLISLADKGVVKVVGGALEEAPGVEGQKILASKAAYDQGVTSPAKLRGRSFGITTAGSSFQYMAHKIAQKSGFADGDIHLRPLQQIPVIIAALKTGQIDAWSIVPNIADALTKGPEVVEIGEIADFIPGYQVTTIFTSTATVTKQPDRVKRFLAAYAKGIADYNAALVDKSMDKDATEAIVQIIHQHVYADQPLDKADRLIRAGAMRISPDASLNLASVKDQLDWFKAERLVPPDSSLENLVDSRFVKTF